MRRDAEAMDVAQDVQVSQLVGHQLLKWASGGQSASELREVCQHALTDGMLHPMVARFAGLRAGQHAHSDLATLLASQTLVPDLVEPIGVCGAATHLIRPSKLIPTLHRFYPR